MLCVWHHMWDDCVLLLVFCFSVMPVGVVATSVDIIDKIKAHHKNKWLVSVSFFNALFLLLPSRFALNEMLWCNKCLGWQRQEIKQEADAGRNSTACLPLITTAVMRKSCERRSRELIHSHSFVFWLQLKARVSPFPPRDPRSPGTGFVFRRRPTSSASRRGICRGRRPPLDRLAPSSRWSPSRSAASGGRPVCSRCNLRRRVEREDQDRDPGGGWRWVTAEYCVSRSVQLRPCVCVCLSCDFLLRLLLPNERKSKERPEGGAAVAASSSGRRRRS